MIGIHAHEGSETVDPATRGTSPWHPGAQGPRGRQESLTGRRRPGIHAHEGSDNFIENLANNLLFAAILTLFSLPSCTCTNLLKHDQ